MYTQWNCPLKIASPMNGQKTQVNLKGNYTSKSVYRSWEALHEWKRVHKVFCAKCDKLPYHKCTSLNIEMVGGCGAYQTSVTVFSSLASLVATSMIHLMLQPNCWWSSCIVGKVGARFRPGTIICRIKIYLWFCCIDFDLCESDNVVVLLLL